MIESASLSQLAALEHSVLHGKNVSFDSVSIDTRTLNTGDLFVAIRGDAFDGHDYVSQAEKAGCCGVVTEVMTQEISGSSVEVKNTTQALGDIAGINRTAFKGTVFGLTGSSGKTTTKNMLASILGLIAPTCATDGNFNNEIGVPLTLLKLDSQHEYAVIEMGARALGDIHYLSEIVKPDVAILLNAGVAHIENFGSYENIVATKGEIFASLGDQGIGIVNADDPAESIWMAQISNKVFSFSMSKPVFDKNINQVWAEDIVCESESTRYVLHYENQKQEVVLSAPGKHNVSNSLAAAAAALAVGCSMTLIAQGLAAAKNNTGRLETVKLSKSMTIIDDSYNANPDSMKAALDVLSLGLGYKVAVLGEMGELGDVSETLHLELASFGASTDIDKFYLIGPHAEGMKEVIGDRAQAFMTKQALADQVCKELVNGEMILVKGSRFTAMDDVVELIKRQVK